MNWLKRFSGMFTKSSQTISANSVVYDFNRQSVNEKLEVVFSCIRDKAETSASIPIKLYRGEELISKGRDWSIFTQSPTSFMTWQSFIEMAVWWYEKRGVFYAYKNRNKYGQVSEIVPFRYQANVTVQMDQNGRVYYLYTTNDMKSSIPYSEDDLFVIKGTTRDGFTPMSPLTEAANLFDISSAQESNYKSLQEDGITSQMALATDAVFNNDNARQAMKEDWAAFRGSKGFGNIPLFENGIKPVSLKLTPQETELLKSREFSVNRICRVFRVPTHRVGVETGSSQNGVFDLDEAYFRNSICPILSKIKSEINKCVRDGFRVDFKYNAFYAGSPWRMAEAIDKSVKGGFLSINEARLDMGMEPVEGGDVFAVDNNNVLYSTWDKLEEKQAMLYQQSQNQNDSINDQENQDNEVK